MKQKLKKKRKQKPKKKIKQKPKFWVIFILLLIILAILCYNGYLRPNHWFTRHYPVHGIDVSHHQNQIDWSLVARSNKVKFAFIKATEGKDFNDQLFKTNWVESAQAGIVRGAYHYFTVTSTGMEQARHFIATVPREANSLPPMVDIEQPGLSRTKFRRELTAFLKTVENHYGQKPILYVVYPLYEKYIKGDFIDYQLWISDILKPPQLSDRRKWQLWQYDNRGRIPGIETFVDLNVWDKEPSTGPPYPTGIKQDENSYNRQ